MATTQVGRKSIRLKMCVRKANPARQTSHELALVDYEANNLEMHGATQYMNDVRYVPSRSCSTQP